MHTIGRTHQLVVQCPNVRPEYIHTSDIKGTQQAIFRNIYEYINKCIFTKAIDKKEALNLKEIKESILKSLEEEKEKQKCGNII